MKQNEVKLSKINYVVGGVASGKTTKMVELAMEQSANKKNIFITLEVGIPQIMKMFSAYCIDKNVHNSYLSNTLIVSKMYLSKKERMSWENVDNIFIDGSFMVSKKELVYLMQNFDGTIYMDYQLPRYAVYGENK